MYILTPEGKEYLKHGLPEKQLLKAGEHPLSEISKMKNLVIALGWAKKNGWIEIKNGFVYITPAGEKALKIKTELESALENPDKASAETIRILLSRNLIKEKKSMEKKKIKFAFFEKIFRWKKKEEKIKIMEKEITQLTPAHLLDKSWKGKTFKAYDTGAPAPEIFPGKKQPYVQFIENVRQKLFGLGFQEVSGPLVETMFWNCDVLFMPQDHPARSIHDVLLLKNPETGKLPDPNLVAKVKATHEGGWIIGSSGWGGTWDESNAAKLLMRSQTTSVSARTLLKYGDKPGKYFTISRVFRHDVIDAKHLVEFDQCDGIVIGENLTLSHLFGFLKELAEAMGAEKIKFKPGYFPFTEPSCELFIFIPGVGWIECGGAGMLRPEVLKPLGIEHSQVLAWGLGIGRLAMIKLGITDVRMLYSEDISWLRKKSLVL